MRSSLSQMPTPVLSLQHEISFRKKVPKELACMDGVSGCYFGCGRGNPMVCGHGRSPKEIRVKKGIRVSEDLHGLLTSE